MLAARGRAAGPDAPPLLVVGPRPLRRVLAAQAALEPLAFAFVDCSHTEVGGPFGARCLLHYRICRGFPLKERRGCYPMT